MMGVGSFIASTANRPINDGSGIDGITDLAIDDLVLVKNEPVCALVMNPDPFNNKEPVTAIEPDMFIFLDWSIENILVLPVETENKFVSVATISFTVNIPPLLPVTLNILEPLPIKFKVGLFDDADITVLPVTESELKLAVSV
jgi:hypothetical protein